MSLVYSDPLLNGSQRPNPMVDPLMVDQDSLQRTDHLGNNRAAHLRVVEGLVPAARAARAFGTVLLLTFVVGLVGALILQAMLIRDQREIDSQRREVATLENRTSSMRHELAQLEAPARIVREARRLGMVEAVEVVYLTTLSQGLDDDTVQTARSQLQGS